MHHHGYTIGYFLWHGLKQGAGWGVLFGALLFPLGGFIPGAFIGIFAGGVLGIFLGIAIAVYNSLYLNFATNLQQYRRTLTRHAGIVTAILFLMGISVPVLGKPYYMDWILWLRSSGLFFWIPVVSLPSAVMAGLAAANTTHRYADLYAQRMMKQKRDVETVIRNDPPYPEEPIDRLLLRLLFRKVGWIAALLSIAVIFLSLTTFNFADAAGRGILFALVFTIILVTISTLNGALITALNRVYFDEYQPDMPLATYKKRIGWISGITTLIYCVIITGGIFAPFAAFFAVWTARQYADTRYETPEKAKNKAKNDAADRLQLTDAELDELTSEESSEAQQIHRQQ
jgi:hypothetical protein